MPYGGEGLSASDVALLTNGGNNGGGLGFGNGEGAWLIILFLIFAAFGWGGNGNRGGNGGFGGGYSGVADNYVLATDFATIERKLDGVNNGLCDGFYAMAQQFSNTNQNIFNGTAALQQTLCQGFSGVNQAITTNGYETRLGINDLAANLAKCCCDIREGISGVNYNIAMNTNSLQNAMCMNTRDIVEAQNFGTRAILDAITANRIEDKNDRIAQQQNEINALRLAASQEKQNNYLIEQLGQRCPVPAYLTCNPNQSIPVQYVATGYNNCGCNPCGC